MAYEKDVGGPGEILRVLSAPDHEALHRTPSRRLDEQLFELALAVDRIGAEIGEIGCEAREGSDGPVHVGVDMAVERRDPPCAKLRPQCLERPAAGVAEYEVKPGE